MTLPVRLENAITKLYKAFHANELNPEYCTACAVGNICDNLDFWQYLTDAHGSLKLSYIGMVNQQFGKRFFGYTPAELLSIEVAFLEGCGYTLPLNGRHAKPENPKDKNILFDGLTQVIKLLCKLDGVKDVTNYYKVFEFEDDQPKYTLDYIL